MVGRWEVIMGRSLKLNNERMSRIGASPKMSREKRLEEAGRRIESRLEAGRFLASGFKTAFVWASALDRERAEPARAALKLERSIAPGRSGVDTLRPNIGSSGIRERSL